MSKLKKLLSQILNPKLKSKQAITNKTLSSKDLGLSNADLGLSNADLALSNADLIK